MNNPLTVQGGGGILKNFYGKKRPQMEKGPVAQMNQNPMMMAIRQKRDSIAKSNLLQDSSHNKIMKPPGKPMIPQGGLKHPPAKRRGF